MGLEKVIKNLRVNWGRKVLGDNSNGETTQSGHYNDSDCEQASGISKRQVERKIHEIAKKVDRVWQVDKSVREKYKILSPPSKIHSKIMDENKQHDSPPIQPYVLKENRILNKTKADVTDKQDGLLSKEDGIHSPTRKRLKLTEISSPVVIT